jgi:hypothetical protein
MLVTLLGIVMLVRLLHDSKALLPIAFTLLGIVNVPVLPPGHWMRLREVLMSTPLKLA